jgi:GT2 family glycosyltransferase
MSHRIQAVMVNHNTSIFAELALRSLFALNPGLDLTVTLFDNASEDDTESLRAYTTEIGIPFMQTGFNTHTTANTHGEVLRRFILDHPDCDYYLLLDSDICFVQTDTVQTMLNEFASNTFAVQARMSWDGITEMPGAGWQLNTGKPIYWHGRISGDAVLDPALADITGVSPNQGLIQERCHPACSLVKNSAVFRRVVEHIGISTAWIYGETHPHRGFYDTFGLASQVMKTHEQTYRLSSAMVLHWFCVSYDDTAMEHKIRNCRTRLAELTSL